MEELPGPRAHGGEGSQPDKHLFPRMGGSGDPSGAIPSPATLASSAHAGDPSKGAAEEVITQALSTAFSFGCKKKEIFVRIRKASDPEGSDGVVENGKAERGDSSWTSEECEVLSTDGAPAIKPRSHFYA